MNEDHVKVEILGQTYWFRCDDADIDAQEVASYIEKKIKEEKELYNSLPPQKALVLIIMNIAKDLIVAKNKLTKLEQHMMVLAEKIENIIKQDSEIAQKER